MKTALGFWLLAGALLQDVVNQDNDLLCSNHNITDDLALYHLKTNPNCRELFQELPENVEELIEAFVIPGTEKKSEDESQNLDEGITGEEKFKEDAKDSTEDVTKEDAPIDVELPENVDEPPTDVK